MMRSEFNRRAVVRALAATVAMGALFVVWTQAHVGGQRVATIFDDTVECFAPLFAAIACWITARRRPDAKRAWRFLAAAAAAWGIGQAIWSVYEIALKRSAPFPSLADAGYLAFVPVCVVGLLSFPASLRASTQARARAFCDGLVIAAASLFISWDLVLRNVYEMNAGTNAERAISLAYPVADVVLVSVLIFVAARSRISDRPAFAFVGAGLLAFVVADTGFAYWTSTGAYASNDGAITDVGWVLGFILIAAGAVFAIRERSPDPEENRIPASGARLWFPYVPVALALSLGTRMAASSKPIDRFLVWNGSALVFALLARQFFALWENARLGRSLETDRAKLETYAADVERAYEKLSSEQAVKDHFLAVASHELGTPLSAILGLSKTLLHRWSVTSDEEKREFTERMARQVSRLTRVADGLLTVARLEAGAIEVHTQLVPLSPLLYEVVIESVEDPESVRVECAPDMVVRADRDFVAQAIVNLLSNARKYGAPPIVVEASRYGASVRVSVVDSGPGVPESLLEQLFEKFSRAENTTGGLRGAGLGLWIVRTLAQAMGGDAWYEPNTPHGARFTISLPVAAERLETVTA